MSDRRYWKIDGIFPPGVNAEGKFDYNRVNNEGLDNKLLLTTGSADSLVLLYRCNCADDWHIINFTRSGAPQAGYLITENLQRGEYCFGIGDTSQSYIEPEKEKDLYFDVYPNPSGDVFNFEFCIREDASVSIINTKGEVVDFFNIPADSKSYSWKPAKIPQGIYVVRVITSGNKIITSKKIIYAK